MDYKDEREFRHKLKKMTKEELEKEFVKVKELVELNEKELQIAEMKYWSGGFQKRHLQYIEDEIKDREQEEGKEIL